MKDYLGQLIKVGDRVITFSNYHGCSAHYITGTVSRMTDKRIYLSGCVSGDSFSPKLEFTVPWKCVVINKLIYRGAVNNSYSYCPNCGCPLGRWTPDTEKNDDNDHITKCPACECKLDIYVKKTVLELSDGN